MQTPDVLFADGSQAAVAKKILFAQIRIHICSDGFLSAVNKKILFAGVKFILQRSGFLFVVMNSYLQ